MYQKISISFSYSIFLPIFVTSDNIALSEVTKKDTHMKPEEKARIIIDRMLNDAGWEVVDRNHYSPEVSAIAVEEGLLKGNREADYLLFLMVKLLAYWKQRKNLCQFILNLWQTRLKNILEVYLIGVRLG